MKVTAISAFCLFAALAAAHGQQGNGAHKGRRSRNHKHSSEFSAEVSANAARSTPTSTAPASTIASGNIWEKYKGVPIINLATPTTVVHHVPIGHGPVVVEHKSSTSAHFELPWNKHGSTPIIKNPSGPVINKPGSPGRGKIGMPVQPKVLM
ncbi:hypothetical protein GGI12_004048 [Dipsacomyces acuminosporus]|nr:hypothetical protein GGI12_004048 [Dipsacomyces acuminosporus]